MFSNMHRQKQARALQGEQNTIFDRLLHGGTALS